MNLGFCHFSGFYLRHLFGCNDKIAVIDFMCKYTRSRTVAFYFFGFDDMIVVFFLKVVVIATTESYIFCINMQFSVFNL